jgi:hypothetical protein
MLSYRNLTAGSSEKNWICFLLTASLVILLQVSLSGNAKRVEETPATVVKDGEDFAAELLGMVNPGQDDTFRGVLETYLIETIKDELRFCCSNCSNFETCIDLKNLSVGPLFKERAEGRDSDDIKREIALRINQALQRTPHLETTGRISFCKDSGINTLPRL